MILEALWVAQTFPHSSVNSSTNTEKYEAKYLDYVAVSRVLTYYKDDY